jgi:C4-dicarboxylate-specific signal transduction histidine kinase
VLINLTQNALDAMENLPAAQKRLVVRIGPADGGMVQVSVIDGGSGVSKEICGKIFESYFTTKAKGLGLGLPICRSIVESHGGRLSAFANEDRGMTFEFTLPPAGQG